MNNGNEIISQEGTTLGDTYAMSFYTLTTIITQRRLRSISYVKHVWLADAGAGKINPVKQ